MNPRKCAKLGFYCVGIRQLECADRLNCAAKVSFGQHLFYQKPEEVDRAVQRLKTAHSKDCKFSKKQFPAGLEEGVVSRKVLYLYAREIYEGNLKSLQGSLPHFNQELAINLLAKVVKLKE